LLNRLAIESNFGMDGILKTTIFEFKENRKFAPPLNSIYE